MRGCCGAVRVAMVGWGGALGAPLGRFGAALGGVPPDGRGPRRRAHVAALAGTEGLRPRELRGAAERYNSVFLCPRSYSCACLAAGTACAAVTAVLTGQVGAGRGWRGGCGASWGPYGVSWGLYGVLGSVGCHGALWGLQGPYGVFWGSVECSGGSMGHRGDAVGCLWDPIGHHRALWGVVGILWGVMGTLGHYGTPVQHHGGRMGCHGDCMGCCGVL